MYKSINLNKEWVKSVDFEIFKENPVIKLLEPKRQKEMYESITETKLYVSEITGKSAIVKDKKKKKGV